MELSEKDLEEFIKKQVSMELMNEIEIPNIDNQWNKIKNQILQAEEAELEQSGKSIFRRIIKRKMAWTAAVLVLAVSFTLFSTGNANALSDKIIEFFSAMVGKTTVNKAESYMDTSKPKLADHEDIDPFSEVELTLEEAKTVVPYKLVEPQYLPSNATLEKIILISTVNDDSNIDKIQMRYKIDNEILIFVQAKSDKSSSRVSLYDTDDTVGQNILIANNPAFIYTSKNGVTRLSWQAKGLLLQLSGKLPKEEIIKIANSVE